MQQYSSNISRKQKTHPNLTAKTKKYPFLNQKPTKAQFTPLYFCLKSIVFSHFSSKRRKSWQKVKKR